jgi:phospholipid/cholesterol/gamma-HCH transport system substrate-binding protein
VIKTAPSPLRLAALIGFVLSCVLVLTYLWIDFGGSIPLAPQGYRVQVAFAQANELYAGADVRIAGVNVGKVVGLSLDRHDNRTLATLELSRQYAPIPRDTRATLRIKTLLGETYVELSTGDRSSGALRDGGRLPDGQVEPDVTLDQILATFDPATRRAFQTWMQAQAEAVLDRGEDINAALGSLPGFVDSGESLLATLDQQTSAVRGVVANTGTFFNAISARTGQLSGLIAAADDLFQTTARRNQDLADVFKALPAFELQSRLALPALTEFARQADPVVRALDPIASELTGTFASTEKLAPQLRGLLERLGPTVKASERGLPALDEILARIPPLLGAFAPFLRNADPMVRYIGMFKPEIAGFFANVTAASQADNLNPPNAPGREVHYLRTTQTLTPESLAFLPRPLGINRDNAYRAPGAYKRLATGLSVLDPSECSQSNPSPPASTTPASLAQLIQQYVFRTSGTDIAAPSCDEQGPIPGFSTVFPQLRADPPPGVTGQS